MPLVPPIITMLSKLAVVDDYDLSSVKITICSGAPLSSKIIEKIVSKFGWDLMEGYGSTECIGSHVTPRGEVKRLGKVGSVGILMPFIEAKVAFCSNPISFTLNILIAFLLRLWIRKILK